MSSLSLHSGIKSGLLPLKKRGLHKVWVLLEDAVCRWKWNTDVEYSSEALHDDEIAEFDSDASEEL